MAEIRILDKHTAELIAAGEVVERPASVAKELLENAIDAGATQITLSIVRGGIQQLQIVDNGSGIETEYIENAFIRHATSKIATAEDLGNIHTLGFRGEALASIASVARVEVLTRTEEDEFACVYRIEGGEPQGMEPGARPVGTTITVRELFYNTPARMKFLKKDSSEGTYVAETVLHAALSHPEISFRFIREGKQQFMTPGDGKLLSAAYATLGREFSRDLLPVEHEIELYRVTGLITPPRACRASRSAQHFYVNGRYVKNKTMMAALENAFKGTLMQGKFPGAILMLELPADLVDVNVHPAKTEIRFAKESDVFDAVYRAVRTALSAPGSGECRFEIGHTASEISEDEAAIVVQKPSPAPVSPPPRRPADFSVQTGRPQQKFTTLSAEEFRAMQQLTKEVPARPLPGGFGGKIREELHSQPIPYEAAPQKEIRSMVGVQKADSIPQFPDYEALDILPDLEPEPAGIDLKEDKKNDAALEKNVTSVDSFASLSAIPVPEQISMEPEPKHPELRVVGEVFKTYIVAECDGELCFIDKHATHERILFEKLSKNYGHVDAQLLLIPVQVNLSAQEKQAVLDHADLLENLGIEAEDYGGSTVVVRAVPADIPVEDVENFLIEIAAKLADGGKDALTEHTEWVLHSIACRAAIKAGDKTRQEEMVALAQQIMDGSIPPFCPHGRPCVLKITRKELEKQFGRLV